MGSVCPEESGVIEERRVNRKKTLVDGHGDRQRGSRIGIAHNHRWRLSGLPSLRSRFLFLKPTNLLYTRCGFGSVPERFIVGDQWGLHGDGETQAGNKKKGHNKIQLKNVKKDRRNGRKARKKKYAFIALWIKRPPP